MGALNANVFATARLCVAASKRSYFPGILANLHIRQGEDEWEYYERKLKGSPAIIRKTMSSFANSTNTLRIEKGVPV
jgi:solute carrier family 7 (L-type amino acid transporter), member 6